jgi:hypothetical protein
MAKARVPRASLPTAAATEYGVRFETGRPATVRFVRSTTPSPKLGPTYQQDIEPAGRYMLHSPERSGELPRGWEAGEVHFKNPLVLSFNTSGEIRYDDNSWKAQLHRALGGRGKALSCKVAARGHDGIVTVDGDSSTREIVDLTKLVCKR